jgi:hypothetical protein
MYILLKNNKLKEIMLEAIKITGGCKKLAEATNIPLSKMWSYRQHNPALKKERLESILKIINKKIEEQDIQKKLPDNWRQKIGGENCFKKKKKEGVLNNQLKLSRLKIKNKLEDWHKNMKKKNPEAYYLSQYEKFKKIGGYKFLTNNKEKVRNILEKEIADILKKKNIKYKYEPLIKIEDRYYFPDFLIGNVIIEGTMWRGYDKAIKLKEKIKYLKKKYKVYVVVPSKIEKYYLSIKDNLILGLEEFDELTNTFI